LLGDRVANSKVIFEEIISSEAKELKSSIENENKEK